MWDGERSCDPLIKCLCSTSRTQMLKLIAATELDNARCLPSGRSHLIDASAYVICRLWYLSYIAIVQACPEFDACTRVKG
ncbi:hypothetical protein PVAP13_9NG559314 [Panicum virgatum]|uniref:Uncharacterized protein n=1 Tax=Panicum virgatum TaxID=38727 RepID=A0A8T0MVH0_PANVG|nr:hypothetical protein PVAP13_9NG559314 [Panicum virgatum]